MNTFKIINDLSDTIKEQGDYIGGDGLVYCGKCQTPKEYYINAGFLKGRKVRTRCKCEKEADEKEAERRQRLDRYNKIMQLKSAGIPDNELKKYTFAKADGSNNNIMTIARRYVDNFEHIRKHQTKRKGFLLYGNVGAGKTYIAACIANALLDKGYPCLLTNFTRIINGVSGAGFSDKQAYYDSLNKYDLLIIDDLSAERTTDYTSEIVFNVIDNRLRSSKPLIITTNLTMEELKSAEDIKRQRIYSRIFELCTPLKVYGKNRRLTQDSSELMELMGL